MEGADVDDPIPLSALQHAVYCLRQSALIHIERLWEENRFTAEGRVVHAGRRIATAEARLTARDSGKLLAHATSTCLILDPGAAAANGAAANGAATNGAAADGAADA